MNGTLFGIKSGKALKFLTFTNLFDVTFFLVFINKMGREFDKYQDGFSSIDNEGKKAVRYFEKIYEFSDDEILLDICTPLPWLHSEWESCICLDSLDSLVLSSRWSSTWLGISPFLRLRLAFTDHLCFCCYYALYSEDW